MKFGIFYEHQMGRPWADSSEHQLIQDALDQVELADRLGIQYVWEVEHHFLEEYSHSSAPEVFLAACSQRTKNIRLGHGIVLTAPQFNHPARVAERIAMLDLVSNGRVEFGSGESSQRGRAGRLPDRPAAEARRCGSRASRSPSAAWSRRRSPASTASSCRCRRATSCPSRCRSRTRRCGSPAAGARRSCSPPRRASARSRFAFIDPEEARTLGARLRADARRECVPVGLAVNPQVAVRQPDDAPPRRGGGDRRGVEGANFFGYSLGHFYVFGEHRPAVTDVWEEYEQRRADAGLRPRGDRQGGEGGAPRRQGRRRRHDRPAGRDRHARAGARVPPPLRGGRRRPGDLRAPGRPQPPRAHHGEHRAVRPRGAPRVRRARRGAHPAKTSAWRRRSRRRWRRKADGRAARHRRLRVPGASRGSGPTRPAAPRWREWLDQFADDRAAGERDESARDRRLMGRSSRGRRRLVTGGASGIGPDAVATRWAAEGADVLVDRHRRRRRPSGSPSTSAPRRPARRRPTRPRGQRLVAEHADRPVRHRPPQRGRHHHCPARRAPGAPPDPTRPVPLADLTDEAYRRVDGRQPRRRRVRGPRR